MIRAKFYSERLFIFIIIAFGLHTGLRCAGSKPPEPTKLVPKVRIVVYDSEVQAVIDSLQQQILKCEADLKKDGN